MGQILGGRHELVDHIASGAMGDVWRVWDHRDHAYRAGKVLRQADSTSLLRFVRETGWRIDHPHVVTPLSWVGEDDRVVFTMPLVSGGSLATVLADNGPLPVWFVVTVAEQLLDALAAVHAAGLVHRDVKPANILLEATGGGRPFVRLGDFGIAAPVGEPRLTRVSDVIGTTGYLAPEALTGAEPHPSRDIYAVGVVVAQMLMGRRPEAGQVVPPAAAATPLGQWVQSLIGPAEERPTAADARDRLLALDLPRAPRPGDEPVEVFDQLPDLPEGWGPDGPAPVGSAPAVAPVPARREVTAAATQMLPLAAPTVPDEGQRAEGPGRLVVPATSGGWWGPVPLVLIGIGLLLVAVAAWLA